VVLLFQINVFAQSATYTAEQIDKYTLRIYVNYKEDMDQNIEITSYVPNYINKSVKVFYRETEIDGRNYIDIDTRSFYSGIRILLENIDTQEIPFNDIKGIESEEYIRHLHDYGLINGYSDGSFKPGNTITRGEFFTMMIRALKLTVSDNNENNFSDIENHWAKDEILTAVNFGLVKGYDDGTIKPDDNITIGQVALVVDRAYDLNTYGKNMIYYKLPDSHYAKDSMKKLLDAEVLKTSDSTYNNFDIDKLATRAECAMIISRAMTN
jgi:hypothetical protein